jgi:hypothetical protein
VVVIFPIRANAQHSGKHLMAVTNETILLKCAEKNQTRINAKLEKYSKTASVTKNKSLHLV